MTKDDLIEVLARSEAERCERDPAVTWSWQDDDMAEFREAWRTRVRPLVPAVVAFVAEWLEQHADNPDDPGVSDRWCEEMT